MGASALSWMGAEMVMLLLGWLVLLKAVTVDVSPRFALAPASVAVTIHVPPNEDNRGLYVEADGYAYRSSFIQLDGADARITYRIEWAGLEAGDYDVRASVSNSVRIIASDHTTLTVQ